MTAAQLYKQLNEGKIDQSQFMQQIRINPTCKHLINNVMGYSDVVKVLKNKGIISEIKVTSSQKKLLTEDCQCNHKVDEVEIGTDGNSLDDYQLAGDPGVLPNVGEKDILNALEDIKADHPELASIISEFASENMWKDLMMFLQFHDITIGSDGKYHRDPSLNEEIPQDFDNTPDDTMGSDGDSLGDFPTHSAEQTSLTPDNWDKIKNYAKNNSADLFYELEDAESYFYKSEDPNNPNEKGLLDTTIGDPEFQQFVTQILSDHGINVDNNWNILPKIDPQLNESKKPEPTIEIDATEYRKGLRYELDNAKNFNSDKMIANVLRNLAKDAFYYTNREQDAKKYKIDKKTEMVKMTKSNLVDKRNASKKKALKEVDYNPGLHGEDPNHVVIQAKQYINSNPILKQISDRITLYNDPKGALLKFDYWQVLDIDYAQKLALQFNISPVPHDDEDTGDGQGYLLTLKSKSNQRDLGNSFDQFKNRLNELVEEVYNEIQAKQKKALNESKLPYDPKTLGIKPGQVFTLNENLGKFKKGDKIMVEQIKILQEDVEVIFKGKKGARDNFFFDKNDRILL
jgi:hypothetical protein